MLRKQYLVRSVCLSLMVSFAPSSPARIQAPSGDELFQEGNRAEQEHKNQEAAARFQESIKLGNTDAMAGLGNLYRLGLGVNRDYQKALEWYGKAAMRGNARGMRGLGTLYGAGEGVPRDYVKARQWYEKAVAMVSGGGMSDVGQAMPDATSLVCMNTDAASIETL